MDAFQQNRILILVQPCNQIGIGPRFYDKRQLERKPLDVFVAHIVMHFLAILMQRLLRAAALCKTMQVDFNPQLGQFLDFIKQINHAAIIGRPWNIVGYYV